MPADARGVVVFAHASGIGRFSPRNHAVARSLEKAGLATLLFDLLAEEEAQDQDNVLDIALLARRLQMASLWLLEQPGTAHLRLGYFGSGTGAAAALVAAARKHPSAGAVVSRGGRPDLADQHLALVWAPTLLIVGENDPPVVRSNEEALGRMHSTRKLAVIPGASHLFEEPGAREEVSLLARKWFLRYLDPARESAEDGRE